MAEPSIVFTDVNERQGAFHRRIFLMGGVAAFGLLALTGRLAHLQILEGGKYAKLSAANQFNFRLIPPPRGNIYDRNGKLIAGTRPSFRVMIEANEVKNIDETLDQLSYVMPQTESSRRRILRDMNQNQRFVPTIVATDLGWEDFSRVSMYANDIPGVVADQDQMRTYYFGGAFSHVVGYVNKINAKELEKEKAREGGVSDRMLHDPSFRIGKIGIEKAFDEQLRGTPGGKKVEVTATGQVVAEDAEGSIAPVPGKDIVLTLDADIQQRAIEVFGKESGSCVMMNIHTGEVLCMTSSPGFDPNLFVSGISSDAYKLLHDYDRNPLLDKALSSTFPPGSTFKTMVALAALEGGYDPNTVHVCNRIWPWGGHVWKCDHTHGPLNLHQAIVTSCDIYFYQCALAVGPDKIAQVARTFGLGHIFDIGISGQVPGLVPDKAWKKEYFAKSNPANTRWFPGDTPSVGIGQGFTNINPLQSCVMVSRLANGKKAVTPQLVKSIGGVNKVQTEFPDLAANPAHIDFVRAAMADVVSSGTAAGFANLGLGPIVMAGKTGTAQSHDYKGGTGAHGSVGDWEKRDHAWFVAFAPADAPKYAMSVLVQHGGFGASGAAPKAREIMRVALLKDPDIQKRIVGVNIEDSLPDVAQPGDDIGAAPPPPTPIPNVSAEPID